jgi:D-arabinose 1-dehydrogenase-like Zn-dependent alcohol dehydrogenase
MAIPSTMKACVLMAPNAYEVVDRPVPEPGPEDALVRVRACGV